jgi:hypothetical protein
MKNIVELPLELLIKCDENNMFLKYTSKIMKEEMENIDKDTFDKLFMLWIKDEKNFSTNFILKLKLEHAKQIKDLTEEQLEDNQSFRISQYQQPQPEEIQKLLCELTCNITDTIRKLVCDQTDAIQKLLCNQTEALLTNNTEQIKALSIFSSDQYKTLLEFNSKQPNPNDIEKFLCDQADDIQNFLRNQNDNNILLKTRQTTDLWKLQFEHNNALWKLNVDSISHTITHEYKQTSEIYELLNAIKNSQTIQYDKIRNLEFKQMKAMHELQFRHSKKTSERNFEHVKTIELLQYKEAESYFKNMIKNVKKIIFETRQNDCNLTEEHFNLSIKKISNKILDNDEYSKYTKHIQTVKIVILLYLMKKKISELDLDSIPNFVLNNCRLRYFTIVFPKLEITKLIINDDNNRLTISLELVKLLLMLPKLKILKLKIIKSNNDFELPEQKLQIDDLELSINNSWNDENCLHLYRNYSENNITYFDNMLSFIKMCPNLQKLNFNIDILIINNEDLAKLAKILECYNLTDLTLNNFEHDDFINDDKNYVCKEELHFDYLIGQCHYLTNLNLKDNSIASKEAKKIAKIVSKSKTITHLNLSNNNFEYNIVNQTIFDIIEELLTCNSLSHLDLSNNFYGNDDQKDIFFREIESQFPTLDIDELII